VSDDRRHVRSGVRRLFRLAVRRGDLRRDDVDEEVRLHVELRVEQLVRRGLTEAAARAQATEWFAGTGGTLDDAARDLRASATRRETRMALRERLADLRRDLRLAFRSLRRAPAFAAVAALTLALGIGASTAVFGVVYDVLLKPLPFRDPDRLVGVYHHGADGNSVRQGPATYFTYRDHSRVFEDVGAWNTGRASLTGRGEPERVEALFVTDGTLRLLGIRPALGRLFGAADDAPGAPRRVVLSYGQWQRRFGGAPDVVGQSLEVDGTPCEIIGVLPASFRFLRTDPAVLLPMQLDRANVWLVFYFQVVARLKPGVTLDAANADVARLIPRVVDWIPGLAEWKLTPDVRPLSEDVTGGVERVLWVLAGTVGVVLLIAGANVVNLVLVRAEGRARELAVRTALGASRGRVARTLLAESATLALAGGAAGLLLAGAALGLLRRTAPASLPRVEELGVGPAVALFALGTAAAAGLLLGLLPVARLGAPNAMLREGGRGASDAPARRRVYDALVVAQIAMALVLLIVSGLMVRTFVALRQVRPGFTRPEEVQTFRVSVPGALVADARQTARVHAQIAERVRGVPGVVSVGLSSSITLDGDANGNPTFVEHAPVPAGTLPPLVRFKYLGAGYVETMGNRVVAGRPLAWDDVLQPRDVVLVSETMARKYWGTVPNALGKRLTNCSACSWRTVVGVVGDERDDGLSRPAPEIVYWPMLIEQFGDGPISVKRTMAYAVRSTRVGTPGFLRELQRAVWSVRPDLPLADVRTVAELQDRDMARTSFAMVMLAIAAAVALLLGVVGVYGVLAYVAARRTREVGIRMALGARRADVRGLFVRHGLRLALTGVAIGLVASLALTRVMATLLFGVRAVDPLTYVATSAGLVAVALLATWVPARRASRVEPTLAFRSE
jgi:predicted permease